MLLIFTMSVLCREPGLLPQVEEADQVAVDDGGDAAFQRQPEKKSGNGSQNGRIGEYKMAALRGCPRT